MKKYFDLISIGFLILLGPIFVFPKEQWNWVLLVSVFLLFIGRWLIERRFIPKTPIDGALALLLISAFSGVFFISNIRESSGKLAGLVYGIVFFYMLVGALRTPKRLKMAVFAFLLGGLTLAVVGILGRSEYIKGLFSPVGSKLFNLPQINLGLQGAESGINMNPLGGVLLLFVPLGVIQIPILLNKKIRDIPRWKRILYLAGIVLMLGIQALAILGSASLNTWFALSIALLMLVRWKRLIKIGFIILIIMGMFFTFLNIDLRKPDKSRGIRGAITTSLINRIDLWRNAFEVVKKHPVNGIGMDQLRRSPNYLYENSHAHNQFLHTAAELGIPGLLAYVAILWIGFRIAKEVMKYPLPEWMRMASRGLGSGLLGFTLFGMFDAIPLGAKPGIFFWILVALIMSFYLYGKLHEKIVASGELHG